MTDADLSTLPALAQELAELIGTRAMLDLVQQRGGRVIYVPERPLATNEVVRIIGLKKTRKLAERYGGSTLTVPMCRAGNQRNVDAEIYSLHYDHGLSIDQLAEKFDIHWTTVCRAVKRHAERNADQSQTDLFE